jgi:SAM-dependent methyltransferase
MIDRADGYLTGITYTRGYCSELNPLRARLACLNAGLDIGRIATACELGFGQGVSIACHAAASPTQWHGTDLNPDHIAFAQGLAAASGTDIGLHADTFEEFGDRPDLPRFDYIGLHGVWSWVSDRNRAAIVAFVRRKLRPGGIVYMGYNALPGWAACSPIRHLLLEHARRAEAAGLGIVERIDQALASVDRLLMAKPAYTGDNPKVADWFKELKDEDRHYLAHEYFNRDWAPMYFADAVRWLAPAGLSYACSADFVDHIDALGLSEVQRSMLTDISDPQLRESARDFIVNRRFRHDYWASEARMLSGPERAAALRSARVVSMAPSPELPFKMRAALVLNKSGASEAACGAVLEVLADRKPRTLGEIEAAVGHRSHDLTQIVDAVMLLASYGALVAAQDDAATASVRSRTDRLNAHLVAKVHSDGAVRYLASPITGGGVRVGRTQQLFLSALKQGKSRPEEWVEVAAKYAVPKNKDAGLLGEAKAFADDGLPLLRSLQIV